VKGLGWIVGGVAGSVLLTEIALTRLFSALLYYHFSFLAVALALFGLAGGGLRTAHRGGNWSPGATLDFLRRALVRAAAGLLGLVPVTVLAQSMSDQVVAALLLACGSAVPFFFLGEALAVSLAMGRERIHGLYAIDLVSSAGAALAAIGALRLVQGVLVLEVPALIVLFLALMLTPRGRRMPPGLAAAIVGGVVLLAALQRGPLFPSPVSRSGRFVAERWNAHSRVIVADYPGRGRWLVIDKSAASMIPHTPAAADRMPAIDPSWAKQYPDPAYATGRPTRRVAIIGLGGGPDLLPALAAGATRIDGLELNGRILELLQSGLKGWTAIDRRPEVHLVHDEARHALQHSQDRYDVIRANLIDTWAATAQGGFVLAENGIYTVQAWQLFLNRLTPSGIFVNTRWYLAAAPAEAQRLIGLGAEALEREKLSPAGRYLIAVARPVPEFYEPRAGGRLQTITTIVSRRPFLPEEVEGVERFVRRQGGTILLAPDRPPAPEASTWPALLSPESRATVIRSSHWAIDPPTDDHPFFFLQVRPRDVFGLGSAKFGIVSAITFNGVRVLLATVGLAAIAALVVSWWATRGTAGRRERLPPLGRWYFALIGLGYMAVQLALLQRLSIVIGHPVTCLALVVASMLLGTGLGSALAGHERVREVPLVILCIPVMGIVALAAAFGQVGALEELSSVLWAGLLSALVGLVLGVALPTGIRTFALNSTAVAEAWALNGAFSVLGSALAALGGLVIGSRGLLIASVPCYALALLLVALSRRSPWPVHIAATPAAVPSPEPTVA
jgi:hypothetical protein